MQEILGAGMQAVCLQHRDRWQWKQLRAIRRALADIWRIRGQQAGCKQRRLRATLQDQAELLWNSQ